VVAESRIGSLRIRAVTFDLGQTLVDLRDFGTMEAVAREIGIELDADHLAHWYEEVIMENDRKGHGPSFTDFWASVFERALGEPLERARVEAFTDRLTGRTPPALYSDTLRCLDELRRDRRTLAVVSNSPSEASVRRLLKDVDIEPYFDLVVSSGTVGVAKPDPEIFRKTIEKLGVAPQETLHVGDLPFTDARAARAAGLHGLWLNRSGTGFGNELPEVTTLTEVPIYIGQLERGERV
jgi:putative hydrolase of the HAD superfamily